MEIISLLIIIILGVISGTITGLIPGIHINLVSMFILINITYFLGFFEKEYLVIFILAMGVIHTFMDFIPSIIFGVPDSDTSLSVLPAHKLVQEGRAYFALFLSSLGSFMGMIFAFFVLPIFYLFLDFFYELIKSFVPYILIFIILFLLSFEKGINKKFWAVIIILFSGSLGLFSLNSYLFSNPLLPLFTGLFGISTLYLALGNQSSIPKQTFDINFKFNKAYFKSLLIGGFSAIFASISPGVGNAQAATISSVFFKKITSENFIFVLSSINTINFILSFITFYLIGKTRNGSVLVISKIIGIISINDIKTYLIIIFFISIIGFFLTLFIGKILIKNIFKFDEKKINLSILIFLFLIVFILTDFYSILLLIAASFLGILAISLNVRRVHLMSILLIPVIFNLLF